MIAPGSTIGILGGGQLGRMLAVAAAAMGYRTHIYAPDERPPAGDVAARVTRGAYDDLERLGGFARAVDVATFEFENIDAGALAYLAEHVRLHPGPEALATAQERVREKEFVAALGGRTAPFRPVGGLAELRGAVEAVGAPGILKTARFGYDGKGQVRLSGGEDLQRIWQDVGEVPCIYEGFVAFEAEFSILIARGEDGRSRRYPAPRNVHENGILARSILPAGAAVEAQAEEAAALAKRVADALGYVGLLTLEFFAGANGPVFNEMAPRVHNSGHWTIEGARTSQFENHIRAVCGLPLGDTSLSAPEVEMRNLIGREVEDWQTILTDPRAHMHLYGKREVRDGRKMGHVTRLRF